MKFWLFALLLFPALLLPAVAATNQDADFLAARDAFRLGNATKLDTLAARLKHHPLEPYLAYYQLRIRLETASPASIQTFLARTADTPISDRLRAEWLKLLGQKQQWKTFMTEYARLVNTEVEIICYALQARQHLYDDKVGDETRDIWLAGDKELPKSCTPLFDEAMSNGIITETDSWSRLHLVLEAGNVSLAKQISKKLSASHVLATAALDSAAADPERYLNKISLDNASEAQRMIALFALHRLAKQLPQLAYTQWLRIGNKFTLDEQRYFYGWLGYEAARKLDKRALDWYRAAQEIPLNEAQLAWRTRAALRAHDWNEVLLSITVMTPQQQREGVWRYWKARALQAAGQISEAQELLGELSREYNFYGVLAAEELGAASASGIISAHYQPSQAEIDAILARPAIQRTLALYRMDLRTDAALEWIWAVRSFDDKQLLVAAEIARRNEMYDHAISAADRTVQLHDFNLRYVAPYREALQGYIRKNELEEAWVYGLMRQESRFVTQAKSNVGASGIMQIMPATARWIANKLGIKDYRRALVHQLDTNLKLGTYY
ncbi:MAG: transglycosylase SLT domain-containing protein, partial [Gallionellaceae bacterium]|nr:transglycosylase SLT domain-containing protein [Gallionellaceae bacterium]